MGWLSGQFIDIIEWLDDGQDTMVYRFERHNNEIKNGAKLVVRPGQAAVLVNEGGTGVADVFEPGTHELTTANLPILSTLMGWKHGFESPFKAEVYFFKTTKITDLKWGTRAPITVECAGYGMFDLRANGSYVIQIADPAKFLTEKVGTDGNFEVDEISNDLREEILMNVSDRLGEMELDPGKLTGKMKDISEELQAPLQEYFSTLGLEITRFRVSSISMPDDVRKELMEMSRLLPSGVEILQCLAYRRTLPSPVWLIAARSHPCLAYRRTLPSLPDRKSTRLNSSHALISYAVFCLKKKKQRTNTK